jgi:hypothetical protein
LVFGCGRLSQTSLPRGDSSGGVFIAARGDEGSASHKRDSQLTDLLETKPAFFAASWFYRLGLLASGQFTFFHDFCTLSGTFVTLFFFRVSPAASRKSPHRAQVIPVR